MWVVYRKEHDSKFNNEAYWTGDITLTGIPAKSVDLRKAIGFQTAREAYNAAGATSRMDWWKVGSR